MPPIDRVYAGAAIVTTASGTWTPTTPGMGNTFTVPDASGWPASGIFPCKLDKGLSTEEHIICTRSGTTFTVQQRGYDGTSAQAHDNPSIELYWDARTSNLVVDHIDGIEANPHSGVLLSITDHADPALHQFGVSEALGSPGTPTPNNAGQAGAIGVASGAPHSDHQHATPVATATTITGVNGAGSGDNLARANHDHALGNDVVGSAQIANGAINDVNMLDATYSLVFSGTTNPGALAGAGRLWYNTTAGKEALMRRNAANTAWEVVSAQSWVEYVPTYPSMAAVGNAYHKARYTRHGKTIIVNGFFRIGTTTSFAGLTNLAVSLPVTAADLDSFTGGGATQEFFGHSGCRASIGGNGYAGVGITPQAGAAKATDRMNFITTTGFPAWGQTQPAAWATGDRFSYFIEYEAASLEDTAWT